MSKPEIRIRLLDSSEIEECGLMIYQSFADSGKFFHPNTEHDFYTLESAFQELKSRAFGGPLATVSTVLVAELFDSSSNKVIFGPSASASSSADASRRASTIAGATILLLPNAPHVIGIDVLCVASWASNKGIGRKLLQTAFEKAETEYHCSSVRLSCDAANPVSQSLYMTSDMVPREHVSVLVLANEGECRIENEPNLYNERESRVKIRPMTMEDVDACDQLHKRCNGYSRRAEIERLFKISQADESGYVAAPHVVFTTADSIIVGYSTGFTYDGHSIAKSEEAYCALLSQIKSINNKEDTRVFFLSARYPSLLKRLLNPRTGPGLRMRKVMNSMVRGWYQEPSAEYIYSPSVVA